MKPSILLKSLLTAAFLLGTPAAVMAQAQDAPAPAQPAQAAPDSEPLEVSEEQIDSFANAYRAIQTIQQAVQADLVAAIETEGLAVEDYNAIAASQQNPETATDVSPEQSEQFAAAAEQVATLREEARQEMYAAIEAEALTVDEFEQILAQAQQDPDLQQAIAERLVE